MVIHGRMDSPTATRIRLETRQVVLFLIASATAIQFLTAEASATVYPTVTA